MGIWGVIVPTEATNYITNPAFRYGVDSWSNYSTGTATGLRTHTPLYAMKGYYSYLIAKGTAPDTGNYGVAHTVVDFADFDAGETVALSAFVYVTNGRVTLEVEITNAGGSETFSVSQDGPFTGRISVEDTLTADATAMTVRAYVPDDYAGAFYLAGVQLENNTLTTYFDGDSEGCYWLGEKHNSNSFRPVDVRLGGVETDFNTLSYYVTEHNGLSSAATGNSYQSFINLPGGYLRNVRTPIRTGTLIGVLIGTTLEDLHTKRETLQAIFTRDELSSDVTIYYDGSDERLYLDVILDDGFNSFNRDGFSENLAIRLSAVSPFWYQGYQTSYQATVSNSRDATPNYDLLFYLKNGTWSYAGTVSSAPDIYTIKEYNGLLYIGGSFGVVDSVANTSNLCVFDGTSFTALSTGVNGAVRAIEIMPDGTLYIGGDFTSAGGVAGTDYIAYWDGSAFNSVDGGSIDGPVYDIVYGANSLWYAPLLFVAGNMTTPHKVAYLTSTGFTALGTGVSGLVRTIYPTKNYVYIGGDFLNISADTDMRRVARYSYANSTYEAMGTGGADSSVYDIQGADNGIIYFGGEFATIGGVTAPRFAQWVNEGWERVGTSDFTMSGTFGTTGVTHLAKSKQGEIIGSGTFTVTYGAYTFPDYQFIWDTKNYYTLPAFGNFTEFIEVTPSYEYVCGVPGATAHTYGATNEVTNNGTVAIRPNIRIISGAATIFGVSGWIVFINQTTKHKLRYHNGMAGDEILQLINTPSGVQLVSNVDTVPLVSVLPDSDLANFVLDPDTNSLMVYSSLSSTIVLYWINQYWSPDGVA